MFKIVVLSTLICIIYALETPIIGILSQETYIVKKDFPGEEHDAFIAASYVKFLESAGARVIPVWIGQDEEYYRRVVNYTNGVLFPGGGTYFDEPGGYGEAAKQIYQLAVEANDAGVYYPLWGTCLGLQVLGFAAVGEDIRIDCSLKNKAISLNFVEGKETNPLNLPGEDWYKYLPSTSLFVSDFRSGRLFETASNIIINSLRSHNITFNNHGYCLTKDVLEKKEILADWRILSTNVDDLKIEFISAMESVKYPIYAVQFHPEKNQFEYQKREIPHSPEAVKISQYFADFFVNECRKNDNRLPARIEKESLIYNYSPRYTGLVNSSYEQIYVFDQEDFARARLLEI